MTDQRRRKGGHELPDDVQDRPEQNAGYDAAVRGERGSPAPEAATDMDVDEIADEPDASQRGMRIKQERD